MTSRTIKSAAGQPIEIVDDDDWLKLTDSQPHGLKQWSGQKPVLIRYLWEHGEIKDKQSGRATSKLSKQLHKQYPDDAAENITSITALLVSPINQPAFSRDVNGKRTYSINLIALPQTWYSKLMRDIKQRTNGTATAMAEAEIAISNEPAPDVTIDVGPSVISEQPPLTVRPARAEPAIDLDLTAAVAMSLLNSVVEMVSTGGNSGQVAMELTEARQRLAAVLEDNEKWRRRFRESGDELEAVKSERDGLRRRLQQTEANLQAALKGDAAQAVNAEIEKRIGRIMSERPQSAKGA